jgi:hypothetical protein
MVAAAASMAQAASTAFPPRENVNAPAVAASGFPVIAIQCLPYSFGLAAFCACAGAMTNSAIHKARVTAAMTPRQLEIMGSYFKGDGVTCKQFSIVSDLLILNLGRGSVAGFVMQRSNGYSEDPVIRP